MTQIYSFEGHIEGDKKDILTLKQALLEPYNYTLSKDAQIRLKTLYPNRNYKHLTDLPTILIEDGNKEMIEMMLDPKTFTLQPENPHFVNLLEVHFTEDKPLSLTLYGKVKGHLAWSLTKYGLHPVYRHPIFPVITLEDFQSITYRFESYNSNGETHQKIYTL